MYEELQRYRHPNTPEWRGQVMEVHGDIPCARVRDPSEIPWLCGMVSLKRAVWSVT